MHAGPFANIAHGNSSLVADLLGQKLGEYVITESGFGSDMGMEKFIDIVCRAGGINPDTVVLVATVRALKHHGGLDDPDGASAKKQLEAVEAGMANLERHLGIIKEFGVPSVVAVNRRPEDTDEEVELVKKLSAEAGAFGSAISEGFAKGGEGVAELAETVVAACDEKNSFDFLYKAKDSIKTKIETVGHSVYGAEEVVYYLEAERKIEQFTDQGLAELPVCMAKTPLSLSADPELLGAPTGFQLQVRDVRAYTGAGWLVPLCGAIQQMPGLGKTPAAFNVDIDAEGRTVGLF
jgi:formyltetrahydrofolate synthetase